MPATTTHADVETALRDALIEFGAEADAIQPDATWEQLDVDSLDLVELAQVVEEDFGVQITSHDMQNLKTLRDVSDLVVARSA